MIYQQPAGLGKGHQRKMSGLRTKSKKCSRMEKSRSPYTANVVVVGKKDGEGEGMDRLCVNFGPLNRKTICDRYPLPIIMELLRLFWGCEYYTVIDFKAAY